MVTRNDLRTHREEIQREIIYLIGATLSQETILKVCDVVVRHFEVLLEKEKE